MKTKLLLFSILLFTNKIFAQCYLNEVPSYGTPLSTTGSPKLDNILSNESIAMSTLFGVKINLYAYDDSYSPNALAIPSHAAIMLGKTLMLNEFVNTNNVNSIIAIMAHEFAHIIQDKYKLNESGTWVGKYPELHADFIAGWYIGKKKYLTEIELETVAISFWDKGDANYNNIDHHGTKFERMFAFKQGYKKANLEMIDAYNHGVKFIADIDKKINELADKYYGKKTSAEKTNVEVTNSKKPGYVTFSLNPKYKYCKVYFINRQTQASMQEVMRAGFTGYHNMANALGGTFLCELRRNKTNSATFVLPSNTYGIVLEYRGSDSYKYITISPNQTTYMTLPKN